MHYFLIIGAFIFLAFMAPPMVTLATLGGLAVVGAVGVGTVRTVTGATANWIDVYKAVGLAFILALVVALGLSKALGMVNGIVMVGAVLMAYVLGFKISLELEWGAAVVVALITTLVSAALYWLYKTAT